MLNTVGRIIITIIVVVIIVIVQEKICFALRLVGHMLLQSKSDLLVCFSLQFFTNGHVYCGCNLGRIFVIMLILHCAFLLLHSLLCVYFVTYQKYYRNNNNNNNNINASFKYCSSKIGRAHV